MIETLLVNQRENGTRGVRTKMTAMHCVKDREDMHFSLEESPVKDTLRTSFEKILPKAMEGLRCLLILGLR